MKGPREGARVVVRRGRRAFPVWLDRLLEDPAGGPAAAVVACDDPLPAPFFVARAAAAARELGCTRLVVETPAGSLAIDVAALAAGSLQELERALLAGETVWDFVEPGPGGLRLPERTASSAPPRPQPGEWWHRGLRRPHPARGGQPTEILVGGPPAGARGDSGPRLYWTADGSLPEPGAPGTRDLAFSRVGRAAPPRQGGPCLWRAEVPPLPPGTRVRYRIALPTGAWLEEGPPVDEEGRPVPHRGPCHAFLVDPGPPPAWARDAVIYHVFVDRFARAGGWEFAGDGFPLPDGALGEFAGGNLAGVRERLGHVAGLGCTAIWLSPVYRGTAYHGYHVTDLRDVDPRFGTVDELRRLVEEAHGLGLRVVLDFVPNHVGHLHPAFLRAQADPAAPERRSFLFHRWPDRYATFCGVRELPKLNNDDPATRAETIAAARFWLEEVGVDGLRLDHANGLSHDAWVEFRREVKATRPDALLLGEVWDDPCLWLPYAGELDAVFDFASVFALRDAFASCTKPLHELEEDLAYLDALFADVPLLLCRFLDNHDMDRFLAVAGGDAAALKLAAAVLYALSGPVSLYYGTEVGLGQRAPCLDPRTGHLRFEYAREPFPWWRWEAGDEAMRSLYAFFAQLGRLRRRYPALGRGRRVPALADEDLIAFWKVLDGAEPVLVVVNRGGSSRALELAGPHGRAVRGRVPGRAARWLAADGRELLAAED